MAEPLKNLYSAEWVLRLAAACRRVHAAFDDAGFAASVMDATWEAQELKTRTGTLARQLAVFLPEGFQPAAEVLDAIAAEFTGYPAVVFPEFVRMHGQAFPELALYYLHRWTRYSTSEFAIRLFLIQYPDLTMQAVRRWAQDENEHVRRLASEGIRPRLPWAEALPEFKKNPAPVLEVLEKLKDDPSEYVRRSVANNLNDISKDHPLAVLQTARRWSENAPAERQKLIRHALRTQLKAGVPEALALTGILVTACKVNASVLAQPAAVQLNGTVRLHISIENVEPAPVNLRMEYKVYYCKANGTTSAKVFWLGEAVLKPEEVKVFDKKLNFADLTTRRHHTGRHVIEVCVNGSAVAEAFVDLLPQNPL